MNISKYINPDEEISGNSNYKLINQFLLDSELEKRNFIREEIELLEPDIIITAYFSNGKINKDSLNQIFTRSDSSSHNNGTACLENYTFNNKPIKRVETYHFSARRDKPKGGRKLYDDLDFYNPVMNLLFGQKYKVYTPPIPTP